MSFVHALNALEKVNPRLANNLEDSLDFAWERIDQDGGKYFREVIAMIERYLPRSQGFEV